ncbi:MAG: glycosyltransferase family 2 protein [Hyphomicrobiaceae bacterium]
MSESEPLVSVVIPCFNCAATIDATLESIARQTWASLEIIAVDDSSTDETPARLAAWAQREPRLRVLRQPNGGCAAARNAGLAMARGAYVGLIDADDLWQPTYLAEHLALFAAEPDRGVSFTRIHFITHDGQPTGETTRPKLDHITAADILAANPAGCAMMVARRAVIDEVGVFNASLRRAEDQEWLFRVALTPWQIRGIAKPLADYRNSPAGLSANLEAQLGAYEDLLAHVATLAPDVVAAARSRAMGGMLLFCARRAMRMEQGASAIRKYLWQALKTDPALLVSQPRAVLGLAAASLAPRSAQWLLSVTRPDAKAA